MADTLEQQIEKAKKQLAIEMPDVASTPIQPEGTIDKIASWLKGKMIGGQVAAVTDPKTGAITYSQTALEGHSQPEIEDILTHELTHSRQAKAHPASFLSSILGPHFSYNQDPEELEAYQTEHDRALAQHRVPTPGQPAFSGKEGLNTGYDIQLVKELMKRAK